MKIDFLWDEEKTKKLFKPHLILFAVGASMAVVYTLLLPINNPYRLIIIAVPALFVLTMPYYFYMLNKPNPWIRFLMSTLQSQLAVTVFMAVTGGFIGIVQFAPYMLLLFTVFELGTAATLILGSFTIVNFVVLLVWSIFYHPTTTLFDDFFYYVGSYILIVMIERNIGNELSLQFEAKRNLEQVDDLKNQFISLTSHYLRTPLTVFEGFVSTLKNTPLEPELATKVTSIEDTVHRLDVLIDNLLMISTIEKGQTKVYVQPNDLNQLLDTITAEFQQNALVHGVSLHLKKITVIPIFSFDPIKLKTAISNLVENAIEYNKADGSVEITSQVEKNRVIIKISDSGVGIKQENVKTLFSSFSKGSMDEVLNFNHPGIGLSLYITRLIIEAHGGEVSVQSQEGKGSIFTVTLPIK